MNINFKTITENTCNIKVDKYKMINEYTNEIKQLLNINYKFVLILNGEIINDKLTFNELNIKDNTTIIVYKKHKTKNNNNNNELNITTEDGLNDNIIITNLLRNLLSSGTIYVPRTSETEVSLNIKLFPKIIKYIFDNYEITLDDTFEEQLNNIDYKEIIDILDY